MTQVRNGHIGVIRYIQLYCNSVLIVWISWSQVLVGRFHASETARTANVTPPTIQHKDPPWALSGGAKIEF